MSDGAADIEPRILPVRRGNETLTMTAQDLGLFAPRSRSVMTSIGSSPLSLLQSQLASSVSSGKVKSSDQSALSSALSDIDSSLQASGLYGAAPGKSTIDDLISKQVSSGKLTSEQADELQSVFGDFAAKNGATAGSLPSQSSDYDVSGNSDDISSTLNQFLKTLKESSVSGYNATGTTSISLTALLVNIKT